MGVEHMEVESDNYRKDRRSSPSRWELIEQSNCRLIFALILGLFSLLFDLIVQSISGAIEHSFAAAFWRVVSPWLTGISTVVFLICVAVVAWNGYLIKLAHDEKVVKAALLEEKQKQAHIKTRLLEQAYKNEDNIKIATHGDDSTIEIIRRDVILEQARIQEAGKQARAIAGPRQVSEVPEQRAIGPAVHLKKQVIPAAYTMTQALRRFSLSPESVFLGVDGYKEILGCDPARDLCHGALNASTGRGKTFTVRGLETQLLKVNCEVVHCDVKFTLIDEFGNDYRPIAKALLNQGTMQVGKLSLPHLIIREEHAVYFLEWLGGYELKRRMRLYNQGQHTYTVFFLFLEELLYLVGRYKHLGPLLAPLLSVGRSLGIKVFTAAQNFQVQNIKLNSGMRENFESAWYLGGDETSAAALLDMSVRDLRLMQDEYQAQLGRGLSVFRNNKVAYKARLLRSGLADDDFVYWLLGKAEGFTLPDEILPELDDEGQMTPSGLWVPGSVAPGLQDAEEETGGGLPMDEDLREALEACQQGARGPRAIERALAPDCTYYRARQLWDELVTRGLVVAEPESK
jgi:hypothetical protein